jgi:hypothetical protein
MEKLVKSSALILLIGLLIGGMSCGSSGSAKPQSGPLTGNWQISLLRHVQPDPALVFSGFLIQSGNSVTGAVSLGSNCSGVGPITGTVDGQNINLTINEFGEAISLQGTMASGTAPMSGEFSNLAGGCTAFANTGTWSAVQVAPIAGTFHGTFVSSPAIGNGTIEVSGNLDQGPNTGNSTASLSGSITSNSGTQFCSYLSSASVTGLVSGTSVVLNLFGPNGEQTAKFGNLGDNPAVTVTPDGTSISGSYSFPSISSSCAGDQGTFQLTFP